MDEDAPNVDKIFPICQAFNAAYSVGHTFGLNEKRIDIIVKNGNFCRKKSFRVTVNYWRQIIWKHLKSSRVIVGVYTV